jgi:hypothetical protein
MTKIPLRRFNSAGIEVAGQLLDLIKAGHSVDLEGLIDSRQFTEKIGSNNSVEAIKFATRMDCAKYFNELIDAHSSQIPNPESDKGLWTWLAIVFRDQLFKSGKNKIGAQERWIPSTDYRRYYRHLLAGPYFIYKTHEDNPNRALAILCSQVSSPGELVENIQARQDIVRFPSIMEAVTKLYYDPNTGALKRGAGSKNNGGARRFTSVLGQFDLTFDFYGMTPEQILDLLPAEFDRFRKI